MNRAFLWQRGAIQNLGTLPGSNSSKATNRLGHVVGLSTTALWETHAVLWQNGGNTDLGTLPRGTRSVAQAINASGRVAGSSSTSTGATNAVT